MKTIEELKSLVTEIELIEDDKSTFGNLSFEQETRLNNLRWQLNKLIKKL